MGREYEYEKDFWSNRIERLETAELLSQNANQL